MSHITKLNYPIWLKAIANIVEPVFSTSLRAGVEYFHFFPWTNSLLPSYSCLGELGTLL